MAGKSAFPSGAGATFSAMTTAGTDDWSAIGRVRGRAPASLLTPLRPIEGSLRALTPPGGKVRCLPGGLMNENTIMKHKFLCYAPASICFAFKIY